MDVITYQSAINSSKGGSSSGGTGSADNEIKDIHISNMKIQFKYDRLLGIGSNYTGNYFIDTKLDSLVEKVGD